MRLAQATEDTLLGPQNYSPGGQRIRELWWDHPAAMPDPPGGWTSTTVQGSEGERLGLAQAQKPTRSIRSSQASVVQFLGRGTLAHSTAPGARGWDCTERIRPPARATLERQSGPLLPALVPLPVPHPHPSKALTCSALSIPRMKDPRSFCHRRNLPNAEVIC